MYRLLMLFLLIASSELVAEERFANVQMKALHIAGSVHMLDGAGGNIGVSVGVDGTLIVDDQYAPLADRIVAALGELGGDRPRLVLNTHYHGDHTGSNPDFGRTGTIISHENVRVRLLDREGFERSGLPVVTYSDRVNVHFNDEEIEVIHLPSGYTDGDSIVWFKTANVIHLGDHYFNGMFPYVDIDAGGNVDGFIRNLESVVAMVPGDTMIIPGHGPLSDIDRLSENITVLKSSTAMIREMLADGHEIADISTALDGKYPGWGWRFINAERWAKTIEKNDAL
ncbi:MAG: MBL fold metallo-hydrolase [Proteobacteria bacterium]|nr:MBL fold metallo-hydrolase [Pseudomonadota bacterium]